MFPACCYFKDGLQRESSEIGAAFAGDFPSRVQTRSPERGQFGVGGERTDHAGQRRVIILFVAAEMILAAEAAGGNLHEVSGFHGRAGTAMQC